MSAKRTKMGMSRKERFLRGIGLWSAFLMLLTCFSLIVLLVMDIAGLNILENEDGPRNYWVQFQSEERLLLDMNYRRGEVIDKPGNPTHSEDEYFKYTFRGWDISGDNNPDFIPSRAYYSFLAVAVFQKIQIKPLPKPSSEEPETSEEDSSSDLESSSNATYSFDEVVVYGA